MTDLMIMGRVRERLEEIKKRHRGAHPGECVMFSGVNCECTLCLCNDIYAFLDHEASIHEREILAARSDQRRKTLEDVAEIADKYLSDPEKCMYRVNIGNQIRQIIGELK